MLDLDALDAPALLTPHAAISRKLRRRCITRSANAPTGDLAEALFCRAFARTMAQKSEAGADAVDGAGRPVQINARRLTVGNESRQLGQIRDFPAKAFDTLAAVLFYEDYRVVKAALFPHKRVVEEANDVKHTNSWLPLFRDSVISLAEVEDVTLKLQQAETAHLSLRLAAWPRVGADGITICEVGALQSAWSCATRRAITA